MSQFRRLLLIACLFALVVGCGSGGDKGRNKDKDVPKAAEAPAK